MPRTFTTALPDFSKISFTSRLIELAEGVRFVSNVIGVPYDKVRIGLAFIALTAASAATLVESSRS